MNQVAGRGRRPYPLESILRVRLMQNWFARCDPSISEKAEIFVSDRHQIGDRVRLW